MSQFEKAPLTNIFKKNKLQKMISISYYNYTPHTVTNLVQRLLFFGKLEAHVVHIPDYRAQYSYRGHFIFLFSRQSPCNGRNDYSKILLLLVSTTI